MDEADTNVPSRALKYLKMLRDDPQVVFHALLRQSIARPTLRQMINVCGGDEAIRRWDRMERIEKALRHYAEGPDGEVARQALYLPGD